MIHSFNEDYPWARFGNDILLGFNADRSTSVSEHQFLPFLLKEDFDSAVITNSDGTTKPLVVQSSVIVDCPSVGADGGFPLRPLQCAWMIFFVVAIITLIEALKRKKLWLFDTIMMVFVGCLGIVVFMMLFSEHPATSTNLQVLLLNPLPLFFVYRVAKNACRHKADVLELEYAANSIIFYWWLFSTICRGNVRFGIIFAGKKCVEYYLSKEISICLK